MYQQSGYTFEFHGRYYETYKNYYGSDSGYLHLINYIFGQLDVFGENDDNVFYRSANYIDLNFKLNFNNIKPSQNYYSENIYNDIIQSYNNDYNHLLRIPFYNRLMLSLKYDLLTNNSVNTMWGYWYGIYDSGYNNKSYLTTVALITHKSSYFTHMSYLNSIIRREENMNADLHTSDKFESACLYIMRTYLSTYITNDIKNNYTNRKYAERITDEIFDKTVLFGSTFRQTAHGDIHERWIECYLALRPDLPTHTNENKLELKNNIWLTLPIAHIFNTMVYSLIIPYEWIGFNHTIKYYYDFRYYMTRIIRLFYYIETFYRKNNLYKDVYDNAYKDKYQQAKKYFTFLSNLQKALLYNNTAYEVIYFHYILNNNRENQSDHLSILDKCVNHEYFTKFIELYNLDSDPDTLSENNKNINVKLFKLLLKNAMTCIHNSQFLYVNGDVHVLIRFLEFVKDTQFNKQPFEYFNLEYDVSNINNCTYPKYNSFKEKCLNNGEFIKAFNKYYSFINYPFYHGADNYSTQIDASATNKVYNQSMISSITRFYYNSIFLHNNAYIDYDMFFSLETEFNISTIWKQILLTDYKKIVNSAEIIQNNGTLIFNKDTKVEILKFKTNRTYLSYFCDTERKDIRLEKFKAIVDEFKKLIEVYDNATIHKVDYKIALDKILLVNDNYITDITNLLNIVDRINLFKYYVNEYYDDPNITMETKYNIFYYLIPLYFIEIKPYEPGSYNSIIIQDDKTPLLHYLSILKYYLYGNNNKAGQMIRSIAYYYDKKDYTYYHFKDPLPDEIKNKNYFNNIFNDKYFMDLLINYRDLDNPDYLKSADVVRNIFDFNHYLPAILDTDTNKKYYEVNVLNYLLKFLLSIKNNYLNFNTSLFISNNTTYNNIISINSNNINTNLNSRMEISPIFYYIGKFYAENNPTKSNQFFMKFFSYIIDENKILDNPHLYAYINSYHNMFMINKLNNNDYFMYKYSDKIKNVIFNYTHDNIGFYYFDHILAFSNLYLITNNKSIWKKDLPNYINDNGVYDKTAYFEDYVYFLSDFYYHIENFIGRFYVAYGGASDFDFVKIFENNIPLDNYLKDILIKNKEKSKIYLSYIILNFINNQIPNRSLSNQYVECVFIKSLFYFTKIKGNNYNYNNDNENNKKLIHTTYRLIYYMYIMSLKITSQLDDDKFNDGNYHLLDLNKDYNIEDIKITQKYFYYLNMYNAKLNFACSTINYTNFVYENDKFNDDSKLIIKSSDNFKDVAKKISKLLNEYVMGNYSSNIKINNLFVSPLNIYNTFIYLSPIYYVKNDKRIERNSLLIYFNNFNNDYKLLKNNEELYKMIYIDKNILYTYDKYYVSEYIKPIYKNNNEVYLDYSQMTDIYKIIIMYKNNYHLLFNINKFTLYKYNNEIYTTPYFPAKILYNFYNLNSTFHNNNEICDIIDFKMINNEKLIYSKDLYYFFNCINQECNELNNLDHNTSIVYSVDDKHSKLINFINNFLFKDFPQVNSIDKHKLIQFIYKIQSQYYFNTTIPNQQYYPQPNEYKFGTNIFLTSILNTIYDIFNFSIDGSLDIYAILKNNILDILTDINIKYYSYHRPLRNYYNQMYGVSYSFIAEAFDIYREEKFGFNIKENNIYDYRKKVIFNYINTINIIKLYKLQNYNLLNSYIRYMQSHIDYTYKEFFYSTSLKYKNYIPYYFGYTYNQIVKGNNINDEVNHIRHFIFPSILYSFLITDKIYEEELNSINDIFKFYTTIPYKNLYIQAYEYGKNEINKNLKSISNVIINTSNNKIDITEIEHLINLKKYDNYSKIKSDYDTYILYFFRHMLSQLSYFNLLFNFNQSIDYIIIPNDYDKKNIDVIGNFLKNIFKSFTNKEIYVTHETSSITEKDVYYNSIYSDIISFSIIESQYIDDDIMQYYNHMSNNYIKDFTLIKFKNYPFNINKPNINDDILNLLMKSYSPYLNRSILMDKIFNFNIDIKKYIINYFKSEIIDKMNISVHELIEKFNKISDINNFILITKIINNDKIVLETHNIYILSDFINQYIINADFTNNKCVLINNLLKSILNYTHNVNYKHIILNIIENIVYATNVYNPINVTKLLNKIKDLSINQIWSDVTNAYTENYLKHFYLFYNNFNDTNLYSLDKIKAFYKALSKDEFNKFNNYIDYNGILNTKNNDLFNNDIKSILKIFNSINYYRLETIKTIPILELVLPLIDSTYNKVIKDNLLYNKYYIKQKISELDTTSPEYNGNKKLLEDFIDPNQNYISFKYYKIIDRFENYITKLFKDFSKVYNILRTLKFIKQFNTDQIHNLSFLFEINLDENNLQVFKTLDLNNTIDSENKSLLGPEYKRIFANDYHLIDRINQIIIEYLKESYDLIKEKYNKIFSYIEDEKFIKFITKRQIISEDYLNTIKKYIHYINKLYNKNETDSDYYEFYSKFDVDKLMLLIKDNAAEFLSDLYNKYNNRFNNNHLFDDLELTFTNLTNTNLEEDYNDLDNLFIICNGRFVDYERSKIFKNRIYLRDVVKYAKLQNKGIKKFNTHTIDFISNDNNDKIVKVNLPENSIQKYYDFDIKIYKWDNVKISKYIKPIGKDTIKKHAIYEENKHYWLTNKLIFANEIDKSKCILLCNNEIVPKTLWTVDSKEKNKILLKYTSEEFDLKYSRVANTIGSVSNIYKNYLDRFFMNNNLDYNILMQDYEEQLNDPKFKTPFIAYRHFELLYKITQDFHEKMKHNYVSDPDNAKFLTDLITLMNNYQKEDDRFMNCFSKINTFYNELFRYSPFNIVVEEYKDRNYELIVFDSLIESKYEFEINENYNAIIKNGNEYRINDWFIDDILIIDKKYKNLENLYGNYFYDKYNDYTKISYKLLNTYIFKNFIHYNDFGYKKGFEYINFYDYNIEFKLIHSSITNTDNLYLELFDISSLNYPLVYYNIFKTYIYNKRNVYIDDTHWLKLGGI